MMGGGVANQYDPAFHRQNVNGVSTWIESQPRFHHGNAGLDETYPSVIGASDIADLHDAAVTSQAAFETAAATVFGSWWTSLLAACDAAGLTGGNHAKVSLRKHYTAPVEIP